MKFFKKEKVSINASTGEALKIAYLVTGWLIGYDDFYFAKTSVTSENEIPNQQDYQVEIKKQKRITVDVTVVPWGKPFNLKIEFTLVNLNFEYGTEWIVWSPYNPKLILSVSTYKNSLELFYEKRHQTTHPDITLTFKTGTREEPEEKKLLLQNFKDSLALKQRS